MINRNQSSDKSNALKPKPIRFKGIVVLQRLFGVACHSRPFVGLRRSLRLAPNSTYPTTCDSRRVDKLAHPPLLCLVWEPYFIQGNYYDL